LVKIWGVVAESLDRIDAIVIVGENYMCKCVEWFICIGSRRLW